MARLKARSRAPGVPGDKYSRSGRAAGSGFANAARRDSGIAEALNRGDAGVMEARNPDFRVSFCFPRFRDSGRRRGVQGYGIAETQKGMTALNSGFSVSTGFIRSAVPEACRK